jgi:hypothetical protein
MRMHFHMHNTILTSINGVDWSFVSFMMTQQHKVALLSAEWDERMSTDMKNTKKKRIWRNILLYHPGILPTELRTHTKNVCPNQDSNSICNECEIRRTDAWANLLVSIYCPFRSHPMETSYLNKKRHCASLTEHGNRIVWAFQGSVFVRYRTARCGLAQFHIWACRCHSHDTNYWTPTGSFTM